MMAPIPVVACRMPPMGLHGPRCWQPGEIVTQPQADPRVVADQSTAVHDHVLTKRWAVGGHDHPRARRMPLPGPTVLVRDDAARSDAAHRSRRGSFRASAFCLTKIELVRRANRAHHLARCDAASGAGLRRSR